MKRDATSSRLLNVSLAVLHTPTLTQAVGAMLSLSLSLYKQLFPRVTASARSLSLSDKLQIPDTTADDSFTVEPQGYCASPHTQQHTLASLSLSLSLSQEPQGPLGYAAPNTKCLGFV